MGLSCKGQIEEQAFTWLVSRVKRLISRIWKNLSIRVNTIWSNGV